MAGDDGLLRITTFDAVAHRGRRLAGTVQIDGERDVRGLRAELVRTQVSISAPVPQVDVVAQQEIVGATHLTPGQTHTFWIDVPDDAVPGFTTPNGTLMWSLRVRADVPFFEALTRPFLKPFQKAVPTIGGVDVTPVLVLIACQLVLMLPVAWLETQAVAAVAKAALP